MGVGLYKSIVWLWFWIWFWEINLLYSLVLRAREAFDRAKSNDTIFIEGVRKSEGQAPRKLHFKSTLLPFLKVLPFFNAEIL